MKRAFAVILVASVPLLMFLNAWQVFRFNRTLEDVRVLEEKQRTLIERNKNALVGIEVLSSPSRIDEVADGIEGIEKRADVSRVLIRIDPTEGEDD